MSENRHPKSRYVHIMIKLLKVKYGPKDHRDSWKQQTHWNRNQHHQKMVLQFLSKQPASCWTMGWWAAGTYPSTELLKITEQSRMTPNLKMVTLNHISTNLLEVMFLQLSKNLGCMPTCTTREENDDESFDLYHIRMPSVQAHILCKVVELVETPPPEDFCHPDEPQSYSPSQPSLPKRHH